MVTAVLQKMRGNSERRSPARCGKAGTRPGLANGGGSLAPRLFTVGTPSERLLNSERLLSAQWTELPPCRPTLEVLLPLQRCLSS